MKIRPATSGQWQGPAASIFFLAGPCLALAQWNNPAADLGRFRIRLYETALEMKIDAQQEQRSLQEGALFRREHLFVEQSLNLDLRGYAYHPNLLEFRLQPQLGLSYQQVRFNSSGGNRGDIRFLQRYHADLTVLKQKPFVTNLYADRDLTFRDFDFFTRAQVRSLRYGVNSGYTATQLPITVSYLHLQQSVDDSLRHTLEDREDSFTLNAGYQHGPNSPTGFTYQLSRFDRRETGAATTAGTRHNASLQNTSSWGRNLQTVLQSNATFLLTDVRGYDRANQSFTVNENLAMQHAHRLGSNLNYNFNQRSYSQVNGQDQQAGIGLTHQLYESLASRVTLTGLTQKLHSPTSTLDTRRAGTGLAETYTKRLGTWGRLSVAGELRLEHEQRQSSGQFILLADESHALTDSSAVFLRQPNVRSVTAVTDAKGRHYTELLDYLLIPQGLLMEIRRVPGGLIPNGGAVLVSYTADAPPGGSFTTYGRLLQVRVDLFGDLLSVYGRVNLIDSTGAKFLVLQNSSDRVAGADLKWGWLRAGAEYEDFQSNFSPYRTQRLFEILTYEPGPDTSLSLDFSQTWMQFPGVARNRQNSSVIARYRTNLFHFLRYSLEGGVRREAGRDFDQQLTTLRSQLNFNYGKLTAELGYEYEKASYFKERRLKHYLYFHATRRF